MKFNIAVMCELKKKKTNRRAKVSSMFNIFATNNAYLRTGGASRVKASENSDCFHNESIFTENPHRIPPRVTSNRLLHNVNNWFTFLSGYTMKCLIH